MSASSDWSSPSGELHLADREVHLWRAFLDGQHAAVRRLESVLSDDERVRASRFVSSRDRARFVAARGILRTLLGRYLRKPAASVGLAYEAAGKPRLEAAADPDRAIRFNVAHSGDLAAYAFTLDREVGIDVEAIRSDRAVDQIAERFFSTHEVAELRGVAQELRAEAFFQAWTRKEAYVKARGTGLGIPLNSFDVPVAHGKPDLLVSGDASRWTLRSFRPAGGCAGAVVVEGRDLAFRLLTWDSVGE
jgi:4'-phosphopantetheinyl transferase